VELAKKVVRITGILLFVQFNLAVPFFIFKIGRIKKYLTNINF